MMGGEASKDRVRRDPGLSIAQSKLLENPHMQAGPGPLEPRKSCKETEFTVAMGSGWRLNRLNYDNTLTAEGKRHRSAQEEEARAAFWRLDSSIGRNTVLPKRTQTLTRFMIKFPLSQVFDTETVFSWMVFSHDLNHYILRLSGFHRLQI